MSRQVAHFKLTNVGDYSNVPRDTTDDVLIDMWLKKGKSTNTREAYQRDIALFKSIVQKPLQAVLYSDLQSFSEQILASDAKNTTKARIHNAVKSLFSLAMKLGYIRMNPAAMLDTPKVSNNLAARIMSEEQVLTMLAMAGNERDKAILRLLYESAVRVSELCGLTWADVKPNASVGGQVTVHGKGDKVRSVAISKVAYESLMKLRHGADYDEPVFLSRQEGKGISRVQVYNIVSGAARRAGIDGEVSPHWLRHSHASHALDRGAPIQLVKETLGHANIVTTNNYAHARPNESSSTYLVTADR
jgi:integrase/recombinase XerD